MFQLTSHALKEMDSLNLKVLLEKLEETKLLFMLKMVLLTQLKFVNALDSAAQFKDMN